MYKIIGVDGKEYGPITVEQVRQWIAEGRANAQTRVLQEGATNWTTIGQLPEFAAAAPPIAPITPIAPLQPALLPAAAEQVNGPAIGLIVVALLGGFAQALNLVFRAVGFSFLASRQMPRQAWPAMFAGPIGIADNLICILMAAVVLFGAIKMKKLENYGLALAASILAMIPCVSPCCLLGLPLGIWALVVLLKPEVKSAFH
jgi:GYF domain 2